SSVTARSAIQGCAARISLAEHRVGNGTTVDLFRLSAFVDRPVVRHYDGASRLRRLLTARAHALAMLLVPSLASSSANRVPAGTDRDRDLRAGDARPLHD